MKSMDLLNETMKELNITEQMSVNGDGIRASMAWYCLYGAIAKYGSSYPVGLLQSCKYKNEERSVYFALERFDRLFMLLLY